MVDMGGMTYQDYCFFIGILSIVVSFVFFMGTRL